MENGFIVFQAEPAGVASLWTRRAPRRGVACGPEGRAGGPFRASEFQQAIQQAFHACAPPRRAGRDLAALTAWFISTLGRSSQGHPEGVLRNYPGPGRLAAVSQGAAHALCSTRSSSGSAMASSASASTDFRGSRR